MILASTLHHIKENTERREKKKKDQAGLKKLSNYKTLNKIIQKTLKAEIPNTNFSLLSNAQVLFKRTFRGWPLFFKRTIRQTV
jgi:hypothetical protein